MTKEILKIKVDEDLDYSMLWVRAPDFHNFGEKMEEIEEAVNKAWLETPDAPDEMQALTDSITALTSNSLAQLEEQVKAMPEGEERDQLRQGIEMMKALQADPGEAEAEEDEDEEEDSSDEAPAEESEEDKWEKDPQTLRVNLPEKAEWGAKYEKQLDEFLDQWPAVRSLVHQELFKMYQEIYPDMWDFRRDEPAAALALPEPVSVETIAQLFKITTITLHKNGKVGISGNCTWDEEHGFGVLVKGNKVLRTGAADEAY